jgi:hypothetical protein
MAHWMLGLGPLVDACAKIKLNVGSDIGAKS